MSQRRFYLHVGLAKSGTTFLQDVLFASKDALAQQGAAMLPPRRGGHFQLAIDVVGARRAGDPPGILRARERFREQLAATSVQVGVFTHELMAPAPQHAIEELVRETLAEFEVHVVITVRDVARTLASTWQQNLKQRHTTSLPDFLRDVVDAGPSASFFSASQSPVEVIERWCQVVPVERMHVVVVPPSGTPMEVLLGRFCDALGLDAASLVIPGGRGNPALGNAQAEVLRRVNVALGDRLPHPRTGYREVGKRWFAEGVLARQPGRRPRLPEEMRPWVTASSAAWVEHLRVSGVHVHGDLADLEPDGSVFGSGDDVTADDAALLDIAVEALADVLELRHDELQRSQAGAEPGPPEPGPPAPRAGVVRRAQRLLQRRRRPSTEATGVGP